MANSTPCSLVLDNQNLINGLNFAAYYVSTPIYFVFGVSTRVVTLIAFYKQYKKNKDNGYGFQIIATTCDLLEIIVVTTSFLSFIANGFRFPPGAAWFQRSYVLMWYSAHLSAQYQSFITASLLISLCMAIDRAFALAKPFAYKTIKHGWRRSIAVIACYSLGILTGIFDVFRYDITEDGDLYKYVVNEEYVKMTSSIVLAHVRNAVRMISILALICCNIAMIFCYRSHAKKIAISDATSASRSVKRKATQKTLVLLTICQSTFTAVDVSFYTAYYSLVYATSTFSSCGGKLMAPMNDLTLHAATILEFVALCAISKEFRDTIFGLFRKKKPANAVLALASPQAPIQNRS